MIVLKDGHVLELLNSLGSADGGFGVFLNPVFDQVEGKLKTKTKTKVKTHAFCYLYI